MLCMVCVIMNLIIIIGILLLKVCCRALWGSSLLDFNQRALVSSAMPGPSIGEHHQAPTMENDPATGTTIFDNNNNIGPPTPIIM